MKRVYHKYFIPHAGNNYHPHILHTKRAVFYGVFFLIIKLIVILMVLALPTAVYVLPDVLAQQQKLIVKLTNDLRVRSGLKSLVEKKQLDSSAQSKADDMSANSYFSHKSPTGKTVGDFMHSSGYQYAIAGENLAMGFTTAQQVIDAWVKSPTHYANLIDQNYDDLGVGIETGIYAGEQTVYVAQHFAEPLSTNAPITTIKTVVSTKKLANTDAKKVITPAAATAVLAEKETAAPIPVTFDRSASKIYWQDVDGGTRLVVRAQITGSVQTAAVIIDDQTIELHNASGSLFLGETINPRSSDDIFRVVTLPTLKITDTKGAIFQDNIDWYNIKTVSPTPVEQYMQARGVLTGWSNIFDITRGIYLGFIIFFSLALLLNVLIEIKKQHPHIILQTLSLIGLLACLALV